MPIPYPSSPTVGQTFTYGGITYTWNGVAWTYTQTNTPAVVGSVAVTAPITNSGTPTAPVIGINQSALSITRSQVSDFTSGTVASASVAGTASYATTAGTSVNISGTIAQSQVTNLVTDLAGKANLVGGNSFTGAQVVASSGIAEIPLVVRGTAGQSANLLQIETAISTAIRVNSVGNTTFIGNITSQNNATFTPFSTATVPLTVRGASGQSANLQEWQNSGGTVIAAVSSTGVIRSGVFASTTAGLTGIFTNYDTSGIGIAPSVANQKGLIVRGMTSQTANLQEWQNSSGGTIANVDAFGNAGFGGTAASSSFGLRVATNANPAVIGITVVGAASQSADLQQWRNSAGGTVAKVDANGNIYGGQLRTTNSNFITLERNSGSEITMVRQTASPGVPGANAARLYFRDGTLAGTLRFVSITGASGVEETLIDNISSTSAVASARFTGAGGVNTAGSVISSAGFSLSGTVAPILLNGSAGTSGQVLTSGGAGTTPTWTTVSGGGSFTGGTLTSDLVLAAGSTAVEPLTFQANTSTVGTVSGAMEYDGTVFYQTSNTNPGKALATQNYYYVSSADYGPDFTVNSTAKSLLGGSTVGLTVAAGTTYEYELITAISHQYVTTASISGDYLIVSTTVSGSPVVSTTHQVDYGSNTTGFTTATTLSTVRPTGNVTFMPAITSGTRYAFLRAKGLIRVTGTGTVKIYPAMQTSGASGSGDNIWNVRSGTIFKLTPIGNGTVTQVGAFA